KPSEDNARVRIEIEPVGQGCEVTLTHELPPSWADFAQRAADAWNQMLDSLAKRLASPNDSAEPRSAP
ncbi:MAG TPA: SRPBCC domain-containing protein, partial [Polyangiaceae bacterium]